jgi:aspartyl/asparaginyl beta-hydroxylase (cupin superfamily)
MASVDDGDDDGFNVALVKRRKKWWATNIVRPLASTSPRYFYESSLFPQLCALASQLDTIRSEAIALHRRSSERDVRGSVRGDFSNWTGDSTFETLAAEVGEQGGGWLKWWNNEAPDSPSVTDGLDWTIFGFVYAQGQYLEENGRQCPETMALLKRLPNVRVAGFSRVMPGTTIEPHTGYTGRVYDALAFHMALVVPKRGRCGLQCGNERHIWRKPGETIVFDDTFTHSAWNHAQDSDEGFELENGVRIILYIDFIVDESIWLQTPV